MRNYIALASSAVRDLRQIARGPHLSRITEALQAGLATVPPPGNLDIRALTGAAPWLRLRVGDYRIIYRPLTRDELDEIEQRGEALDGPDGYLVYRIVHRRDLERVVSALP